MKSIRTNPFATIIASASSLTFSVFLIALVATSSASAAALTWDTTIAADGTITAGDGTWTNGAGNWNNGTTSVGINWANSPADSATFAGAAGTYAVSLGGNISSAGMTFNTSGYTLFNATTAQTITSTGNTTLASGVAATIGSNVTVTRNGNDIVTTASSTGGTLNIGSADQSSTGASYVNTQTAASGTQTMSITGGTVVNVNSGGYFGQSASTAYTVLSPLGKAIIIGSAAGGSLVVKTGGTVTNGNGQALILGGAAASGTLTIDGGQVTAGVITAGSTPPSVVPGLRFGAGSLNASGTRVANLNGGTLTVGQVYTGTSAASPTFTNTFNFNGGILQASYANNTAFMTGLTTANVQVGGAKIDTNGFNITIGQALLAGAPSGGLTKSGGGILTLSGTNTYTGDTKVDTGTLALGNTLALQNSAYDTASVGAGLNVTGFATPTLGGLTGSVNLSSSLITGYGSISNMTLNPQTGVTKTYSGDIGNGNGSMILTKTGAGTQVLSGTNSYTGATNINAGTLNIQNADALGSTAGATSVANNATLQLQSASSMAVAAETLNLLSNGANFVVFQNVSGNNEWTGTIASTSVSISNAINVSSESGLMTLSGGISSSGAPYTLRGNGDITISGQITGSTGVTSSSSGTGLRTLSNTNNTYSGATTVTGGRLSVTSTGTINSTSGVSIGSGEFNYNNSTTALSRNVTFSTTGGTLSGTGTIDPAVTITTGNRQTAGTSVTAVNPTAALGKATFSTGITYDSGSIFEWNLTGGAETSVGTRGTNFDAVNTAALAGAGGAIFRVVLNQAQNFSESFWDTDRTWAGIFNNLAENSAYDLSSIFSGGFEYRNSAGVVIGVTTTQGAFTFINGGTDLKWSAVPEPTSALAGLLIGAGLLRRRRNA